jgi:hypothetical protein
MESYTSDPQTRKRKIECKPELVISSLQRFYSNHPEINKVLTYLNGEAPLSLRIIDWFVTKYSRKNFVRYPLNGQDFLVYLSYKGQLKAYSKQYFDPNCRRERIMFKIPNQEQFMTTIGKLNFFRWALESKILEYIEAHEEEIRTGYNSYLKDTTQTQKRVKNETASSTDSNVSSETVQSNITVSTQASQVTQVTQASQSTQSTQGSNSTARTTRRRRTKQTPSSLNKLQVYKIPIELSFD